MPREDRQWNGEMNVKTWAKKNGEWDEWSSRSCANAVCARNASFLLAICWWVFVFALSPCATFLPFFFTLSNFFPHMNFVFYLCDSLNSLNAKQRIVAVFFFFTIRHVWYDYGGDAINSFRQNGFLRATLKFHWFKMLAFVSLFVSFCQFGYCCTPASCGTPAFISISDRIFPIIMEWFYFSLSSRHFSFAFNFIYFVGIVVFLLLFFFLLVI